MQTGAMKGEGGGGDWGGTGRIFESTTNLTQKCATVRYGTTKPAACPALFSGGFGLTDHTIGIWLYENVRIIWDYGTRRVRPLSLS